MDLTEALKAKDSQLAVLRVLIQEVDMELQKKTKTLEEVQEQNERCDFLYPLYKLYAVKNDIVKAKAFQYFC